MWLVLVMCCPIDLSSSPFLLVMQIFVCCDCLLTSKIQPILESDSELLNAHKQKKLRSVYPN